MAISVVVPMYNSEKHIARCLRSILASTYTDMEIICVDDGSMDGTAMICDDFAMDDGRIHVLRREHKGVSAARNAGLEAATKEYISFVDADDYIMSEMYRVILAKMVRHNADIGVTNFIVTDMNGNQEIRKNMDLVPELFSNRELLLYAFARDLYRGITAWVWNKVFRRKRLHRVRFDEDLTVGEDVEWLVRLLQTQMSVVYCDQPLYEHFVHRESLSHAYLPRTFDDRLAAYSRSISLLEEKEIYSDVVVFLKNFYCFHASNYVEVAMHHGDIERANVQRENVRVFFQEYQNVNRAYPDRIQRVRDLMEGKCR